MNEIDRVTPYTKSAGVRLVAMREALLAIDADGIEGDVVECGVWRGGNMMLTRIMSPSRICWLYDTFDGMTKPDEELDIKPKGARAIDRYNAKTKNGAKWNAASLSEVRSLFDKEKLNSSKYVKYVVGPVEETLFKVVPDTIALLRLDVDWHSPTKISLEVLYPRLAKNGFLIVDDYGHWLGCKKAVDDYFGTSPPPHRDIDYSCRVYRKC